MAEDQNPNQSDDGEKDLNWNNAPVMDEGLSTATLDKSVSSWKIIRGCLAAAGITGICLLFSAGIYFLLPNSPLVARFLPSATATFTPTSTSTPTITRTPTVTPTSTNTPTPTPNMTATQQALLDVTNTAQVFQATAAYVAREWKIVLEDNFDSNKNGWGIESSDTEYAKSVIKLADGKYSWDISTHKLEITWESANTPPLGDFVMSVDARQISGPDTAEYGLTFREDVDFHNYYFGITNKGEYFLDLYYYNWIPLIDHTKSELILPNEYNRLTVIAEGSHFTFFINDQYLTEFTDEGMQHGGVGLFSLLQRSNQQAVFEFDNFELRAP